MRTIIVDDEPLMLKRFRRMSADIPDLHLTGQFESAKAALTYAEQHPVELAFLDVEMPIMNGIELAKQLRRLRPDMLIVFITAYDSYVWDSTQIGGDYYMMKPYSRENLEMVMERLRLISQRQKKQVYIQTFGRFVVLKNGEPIPLTGKAKEILALVVTRRGREISNLELYNTIWEGRPYSNANMSVFHNALRRLRLALKKASLEKLLISSSRGQMVDTSLFDCDYYAWEDKNPEQRDRFTGEFLPEYSWGEYILGYIINHEDD